MTLLRDAKVELFVGIYLSFPMFSIMPCGNRFQINSPSEIPDKNIMCPCGDPKHILVMITSDKERYAPA